MLKMQEEKKKVVDYLERVKRNLDQIRRLADDDEDIAIFLMKTWQPETSLDDLAADVRTSIERMKKDKTLEILGKIEGYLMQLNVLTNTDKYALELLEHNYPEELRNVSIEELVYIFRDYTDRISNY